MGMTLAVAGKGGVGKTSISALMIKALIEAGKKPLLAIDADSNSNLHEVLGLAQPRSVGCVREDTRKIGDNIPGGMTKDRFMEYQIQASLEETRDLDFLSMGRPEGPGCYCMANNILREVIGKLTGNYKFVVIDNEAGMEHLSRRTEEEVDHLFVVSDPAPRIVDARRYWHMAEAIPACKASTFGLVPLSQPVNISYQDSSIIPSHIPREEAE